MMKPDSPLQKIAFSLADEHWESFKETRLVEVDRKFSCVIYRIDLPPVIAIAGRAELVALEVAGQIEARISELNHAQAMGVGA